MRNEKRYTNLALGELRKVHRLSGSNYTTMQREIWDRGLKIGVRTIGNWISGKTSITVRDLDALRMIRIQMEGEKQS